MNKDGQGGYASVNGLKMYYEIHGTGNPLVLLGGGFMTIEAMGQVLSFELMADDIAALIKHLGVARADVFGYSLGGGVALQTAIRHPEVVRKLVLASTPYRRKGLYPEVRAAMASMNAETVLISPPTFVAKMRQLLTEDYDWAQDVAAMKVPTLIMIGDADDVPPMHASRDVWPARRWQGRR